VRQALQGALNDRPALNWVDGLTLEGIDGGNATFAVRPDQSQVQNFITPARQQQLADLLGELLGRTMRVQIERVQWEASMPPPAQQRSRPGRPDPSDVADLPMVQQIMETFDVSLVDVRREDALDQPTPPTDADAEDDDAGES